GLVGKPTLNLRQIERLSRARKAYAGQLFFKQFSTRQFDGIAQRARAAHLREVESEARILPFEIGVLYRYVIHPLLVVKEAVPAVLVFDILPVLFIEVYNLFPRLFRRGGVTTFDVGGEHAFFCLKAHLLLVNTVLVVKTEGLPIALQSVVEVADLS